MRPVLLLVVLAAAVNRVQALQEQIELGKCEIYDTTNSDGVVVKETRDCDWGGWALEFIPSAIPLVMGLLIFFPGCMLFFCGRFCCNCCGGTYPSPDNCCCPPREEVSHQAENPYTPGHIKGCKGCAVALGLLALLGAILLLVGIGKEVSAYGKGMDGAIYTADYMNVKMTDFSVCMKRTDPEPAGCSGDTPTSKNCYLLDYDVSSMVTDVTSETDKIKEDIENDRKDSDKYVDQFKPLVWTAGIIPFSLVALGVIFALCNIRKCGPMILLCFVYLFCFILGTELTIQSVVEKVADEGCKEVDKYMEGNMYNLIKVLIDSTCDQKSFDNNKKDVQDALADGSEQGCRELLSVCTASQTYDPTTEPTKIFYSPVCVDSAAGIGQCRQKGLSFVTSILSDPKDPNAPKAKVGTEASACAGGIADCTIKQCGTDCKDADASACAGGIADCTIKQCGTDCKDADA
eukprot:Hpha_TRINITY_DN16444_c0_g5::TRINITY_DN16444_c0_g5_i4::g.161868::m.161868